MTKEIEGWADSAMYTAERSDAVAGPQAFLISATPDPLGAIAVAAEAYEGRFYESKDDITDEMRNRYLEEMQKTILAMPLEAVHFHWRIKGVTRSFTHQMVRQRTAAYSQESMRFAVKEDLATAVALPPSLQKFNKFAYEGAEMCYGDVIWRDYWDTVGDGSQEFHFDRLTTEQQWYIRWREAVEMVSKTYNDLVNGGMPAEEARGLTPHNTVTQLNYITNLRNYKDHAGLRLCTQAQFEWRSVWVAMLLTMRDHCSGGCEIYIVQDHTGKQVSSKHDGDCDNWQWRKISELFLPVCYYKGRCQFMADFDRKCNIRPRVEAFAAAGIPSTEWDHDYDPPGAPDLVPADGVVVGGQGTPVFIGAIQPHEWLLNDAAAR